MVYLQLTPKQSKKLQCLSIVHECSLKRSVPYSLFIEKLALGSERELEDLLIECIYASLVRGKLDQRKQVFDVEAVMGRDVDLKTDQGGGAGDGLDNMVSCLEEWEKRAGLFHICLH